ncbi:hypothetical protein HPB51_015087 [Rhipicephalus microplus]|uniref:Peptidase M13 C-terminal domain-containing protein n=1 Tax=Rhipicephalus microplus TaxID=6941 RepID=A0A9J6ETV4_RHIMP|nr:hypothetical protein HPB51_015087 [Rhipicephalus microplus]
MMGSFVIHSPELNKGPFSMPVYGLRVIRELFKVIDYRAQWWVGKDSTSEVAYQKLEDCVKDIERIYRINEPVERYEAIAEIAAVHVIFKMYTDEVDISKKTAVDVRLPFFQTVPSTTQFFIALASEMCARTNVTIARLLNKSFGSKTAEQRMEVLATHMPQYTDHFGCTGSQRMRVSSRYMRCVFWNH